MPMPQNRIFEKIPATLTEIEMALFNSTSLSTLMPNIERVYRETLPETHDRSRAAFLMGASYETLDLKTSKKYYDEGHRIATYLQDKRLLSDSLHGQAYHSFRSGKLNDAYKLELESLSHAIDIDHFFRVVFSRYMLGTIALFFGAVEEGLDFLNTAITVAKQNGLIKLQVRVFSKLAELCLASKELSRALFFAEEAISSAQKVALIEETREAQTKLATIELELKKYGEVTKLVSEVRKTLPKENHSLWCVTHTLMGKVHEAKRRYDKAETEFRTALSLADYVNAERVRSNVHVHLAELYLKTKKPKLALKESLAAVADAEKAQDAYVRKEALRSTHECYKALGKYKQAHDYLEQYNALVAESDTALLKSRLEYHALKNDYELEKVKSETQTKKSELLRIKLDYKERELTEKIRHLIKQAEAVRQFRNDLRALVRRTPADDPPRW